MSLTLDRQWFYIRVSGYCQGYGKGQQCPKKKKKAETSEEEKHKTKKV